MYQQQQKNNQQISAIISNNGTLISKYQKLSVKKWQLQYFLKQVMFRGKV